MQHRLFWAQMALAGPKKSRFSGPTSNAPRNDVAPLKTNTYRAIKTTGTLIVISTGAAVPVNFDFQVQLLPCVLCRSYSCFILIKLVSKFPWLVIVLCRIASMCTSWSTLRTGLWPREPSSMSSYAGKTFAWFHHEKILSYHHSCIGITKLTPSNNAYIGPH